MKINILCEKLFKKIRGRSSFLCDACEESDGTDGEAVTFFLFLGSCVLPALPPFADFLSNPHLSYHAAGILHFQASVRFFGRMSFLAKRVLVFSVG
ncbi:hypothetical protein CXU05_06380 [Akkermansia muciniphila]|nr:hypothetical protein CXU05_06380 [Akkermansia muciniphila]